MKKPAYHVCLILASCLTIFSSSFANPDRVEIDALNLQAFEATLAKDLNKADKLTAKALQLLKAAQYEKGEAENYLVSGLIHLKRNQPEEAIGKFKSAIRMKDFLGEKLSEADLYAYYGEALFKNNDLDRASEYTLRATKLFESNKDYASTARSFNTLAINYCYRGLYTEAAEHLLNGLSVIAADTQPDSVSIYEKSRLYANLGIVYNRMFDFDQALEVLRKSKALKLKNGNLNISSILNTMGAIHHKQHQPDSALYFYKASIRNKIEINNKKSLAVVLGNVAMIYLDLNQVDSSKHYLDRSFAVALENGNQNRISITHNLFTEYYYAVGQYKKAEEHAWQTLDYVALNKNPRLGKESYKWLYLTKEAQDEFDSALFYHKRYKAMSDSVYNTSNEKKFADLRVKLETQEKQNELKLLAKQLDLEKAQNTITVITLILILLVAAGVVTYLKTVNKKKKVALENSELQKQNLQQKIQFDQQELSNHTLSMILKNNFLTELESRLDDLKTANGSTLQEINKMIKDIQLNRQAGKDWEKFQTYFGKAHPDFYKSIKERYPELTSADLRQCALLKMNLSLKESAEILGVDHNSVKMARYRMKKKIGLAEKETLHSAIIAI